MKYVKRADGKGYIVDGNGKPIPIELLDEEVTEQPDRTKKEIEEDIKRLGLSDKS